MSSKAPERETLYKSEIDPLTRNLVQRPFIGTLGERGLHADLKAWYAKPGDVLEKEVNGFHVDIVRDTLLIEIQTKNFSSVRKKLTALLETNPVRLIFPIAYETWILRLADDRVTQLSRRKSPKRGYLLQLFEELVRIPSLVKNHNFSLEILFIRKEEVRCNDGRGSWRRKGWSLVEHRLLEVMSRQIFWKPEDFLSLIPPELPAPFSSLELGKAIGQPRWLAQQMAYCLRHMGVLDVVGKRGNAFLYSPSNAVST